MQGNLNGKSCNCHHTAAIQEAFPSVHLEDKVMLQGEGIVTYPGERENAESAAKAAKKGKKIIPLPYHYSRRNNKGKGGITDLNN